MKMKPLFLVLIFVAISSASKITLEELASMDVSQLKEGQMVEVTHSSQEDADTSFDSLEREYYIMRSTHRDKRSAYMHMNQMIEKVVFILKKYKVIPHERSLVKSKIKPQYLSKKRKWSFSTMFVVLGKYEELKKAYSYFIRMGIQKLNAKPSINFLNEKVKALELFASAKAKLENQLKRFPNFEIRQIEEIQIDGLHMPNSDMIEKQIQEQFSDSEENMEESEIQEDIGREEKSQLTVKVLFQVTENGDEDQSLVEFEEEGEQDSNGTQDDTESESI